VKQGGVEVEEPTTKRSFVLRAADGEVEVVDKDGSVLTSKEFKMRRGRQTLLHVTWVPARPAAAKRPSASLLDKLDPAKIPAAVRFEKMPPEVVGGFGKREKGKWDLQDYVTLSTDGKTALACREGKIVIWDVASGIERSFGPRGGGRAALSAAGRRALMSSTEDRGVASCSLWDVATGKELKRSGPDFSVIFWLEFDPSDKEGRRALLAHRDHHDGPTTIRLWDVTTGKELKVYKGHKHYSGAGAFSRDGRRFVSSGHGRDQSIRLWDVEKGQELSHADLGVFGGASVSAVAFSRDGRFVLVGGATLVKDRPSDGRVWLWDTEQKKPLVRAIINTDKPVRSVAVSPDGKVLAAIRSDARVLLVEFPSGKAIREIQLERPPDECGACVAFAPDGRHLLAAHGNGAVYVLRLTKPATPPGTDKY
jgi:WD40 repeat protein